MGISSVAMTSASQAADFQFQPPAISGMQAAAGSVSQQQNASQQTEPTMDQLKQAVNQINQDIQSVNKDVQFSLDQQSGRIVVKVMDTQNNEVIRQIPTKETLAIAEALGKLQGLIIHQKA